MMIDGLQEQNQQLLQDKAAIEDMKQNNIVMLAGGIKSLEQQLIATNMEIADFQSQLEIEQGLVSKLRAEKDAMTPEKKGLLLGQNQVGEGKAPVQEATPKANVLTSMFKWGSKKPAAQP